MDVSVIIPTYNRTEELRETLYSVLTQTVSLKEIIIVDDSDNFETKDLISQLSKEFLCRKVTLEYVHNTKRKSLTVARNLGVQLATGDIIMFLDDDVVLDSKYVEKILDVYKTHPHAQGVQGYIKQSFSKVETLLCKAFFLSYAHKNTSKILPSGEEITPYPLTKVINCQRLSGANQSYQRTVFQRFKFDERLCRYAYMEDVDFSYRIYKVYPNALYATPYAKLIHKTKESERPNNSRIFMKTVYRTYFFYKNINQTSLNILAFVWSIFGRFVIELGTLLLKNKSRLEWLNIIFLIESYFYTLRHLKKIKQGNLEFFNKQLKG